MGRIVLVAIVTLLAGCAGYVIAQHQQGKRFSLTDPSDEQPSPEANTAAVSNPLTTLGAG
jgi:hypothetical protein